MGLWWGFDGFLVRLWWGFVWALVGLVGLCRALVRLRWGFGEAMVRL